MTLSVANSTGKTVVQQHLRRNRRQQSQPFTWNGQMCNDGTQWPDGQYTLTATATDGSGNSVGITTEVQGVVSSVDLTQTPPLLSIGGQSYTVDQIKSISD